MNQKIYPFNLTTPNERREMFARPLPAEVMLVISLLKSPDLCNHCGKEAYFKIHDQIIEVAQQCIGHAKDFAINASMEVSHGMFDEITVDRIGFAPEQEKWQVHWLYPQVSFLDASRVRFRDPEFWTATAMTIYDRGCCLSQRTNPQDHVAIDVGATDARDFHIGVGDLYRQKVGVLSEELMAFRNMVMIKCRAVLAGRDPDAEYAEYLKVGGYCLSFPASQP